MKVYNLSLNENNTEIKYKLNPEDPFIKVTTSGLGYSDNGHSNSEIAIIEFKLIKYYGEPIISSIVYSPNPKLETKDFNFPEYNDSGIKEITITLSECTLKYFHFDFELKIGRKLIDVQNPINDFYDHLSKGINSKILFSGSYGQGKTTFLNHFFEESYQGDYNVFKVFPVNYSVASNEDIFKYIKTDILFQLLGKDVKFDESSITFFQAFQEKVYLEPIKTGHSFLTNLSKLNPKAELIMKGLNSFLNILKPINDYKKTQSINDKSSALQEIEKIYETEGSIFEDNFYTQLIRQLLERLKLESDKENVLIIEDLDRMDPDHIFRILNVISAHYDTYNQGATEESTNKFGFDKIIVVCDIKNIQYIYQHRYGKQADFDGYINKYYSTKPFEYNNNDSIQSFINEFYKKLSRRNNELPANRALICLLKLFVSHNLLSLREVLRLQHVNFDELKLNTNLHSSFNLFKSGFTKALVFLVNSYNKDILYEKIDRLKDSEQNIQEDYHALSLEVMATLSGSLNDQLPIVKFNDLWYKLKYNLHHDFDTFVNVEIQEVHNLNAEIVDSSILLTKSDFCNLLKRNVEHYYAVSYN